MFAALYLALTTLLFVGGPVLAITVLIRRGRARRRRGGEVAAWAAGRGWSVWPVDPTVAGLRCPPVEHDGEGRHVVHGTDAAGRPVVAFEWCYRVVDSEGGNGHVLSTVVATTVPGTHPVVQVSFGRHRGGFLGVGGPDPRTLVTGVPAFDARFSMLADVPHHAARTVPPTVLEWLAVDPRTRTIGFRLAGSWLVTWQNGHIDVPRIEAALGFLDDLRDEIAPEAGPVDPGNGFRVLPEAPAGARGAGSTP